MTTQERHGWVIVGALFLTLVLIVGSCFDTLGVFLTPLQRQFGWSRAQISTFQSAVSLTSGIAGPVVGWLLDRFEARIVMVVGAVLSGLAFLIASQANSYPILLAMYLLAGIGMGAAGFLPATLVVANWFGARRGLAMGFVIAGASFGAAVMTALATVAISYGGWRTGYFALAIPMFVIVIPMILLIVRSRPAGSEGQHVTAAEASAALPGLELGQAIRTQSFWMICIVQFVTVVVVVSCIEHLIPYFVGMGYPRAAAAGLMSAYFLCAACTPPIGFLADRITARLALAVDMVVMAVSMALALGARSTAILVPFVILAGLSAGGPLALAPLLIVDSLGLKRFGSIYGLIGICNVIGGIVGPIMMGRIFDVSHSYRLAFEIFVLLSLIAAVATLACRRFESEQAAFRDPIAAGAGAT